jgi:CRISPR/Cas system-associated exonuclease Cas4 (RecB family)
MKPGKTRSRIPKFWRDLWKREWDFLASGRKEFRHKRSFVPVSDIASQYYCEYKTENEFALGEIPTEAKEAGTVLHDELMPFKRVSAKEFVELVSRREPSYAVLRVWGEIGGLKVIGTPDHIVWESGRPIWLVELKTTKGDPTPLWEDQENQARIYGLLLDRMGLDCSKLRLAVVRLKTVELTDDQKREWVARVSAALQDEKVGELESQHRGTMKVHLLSHDRTAAERAVLQKAGYWLGKREPTSSTSLGKCRACEYNDVCPKSLLRAV